MGRRDRHLAATRTLSLGQARRVALGAQGFARARPPGRVDRRHLRRLLDDLGVIQIDSVNVLVRSQELPLFARLGAHPRDLIPAATVAGELFEYWVHEASHVPTADHHLYRWRMRNPLMWRSHERLQRERPGFIREIEHYVAANGPVVASDLRQRSGPKGTWWDWDDGKIALEVLFHQGRVAATRRSHDFARVYDLAERVLPPGVWEQPELADREARKQLVVKAARSLGIATDKDLADYHRQKVTEIRPLLHELVDEQRLEPVSVSGWPMLAYLHPDAIVPRSIETFALLSPFDPVVWNRDRAERLFDFHYRIEIYTPAAKRRYGYYVLPILYNDELVGRIDLKADRAASVLRVQAAWVEDGANPADVGIELSAELARMARWLNLDDVVWAGAGNLRA